MTTDYNHARINEIHDLLNRWVREVSTRLAAIEAKLADEIEAMNTLDERLRRLSLRVAAFEEVAKLEAKAHATECDKSPGPISTWPAVVGEARLLSQSFAEHEERNLGTANYNDFVAGWFGARASQPSLPVLPAGTLPTVEGDYRMSNRGSGIYEWRHIVRVAHIKGEWMLRFFDNGEWIALTQYSDRQFAGPIPLPQETK